MNGRLFATLAILLPFFVMTVLGCLPDFSLMCLLHALYFGVFLLQQFHETLNLALVILPHQRQILIEFAPVLFFHFFNLENVYDRVVLTA